MVGNGARTGIFPCPLKFLWPVESSFVSILNLHYPWLLGSGASFWRSFLLSLCGKLFVILCSAEFTLRAVNIQNSCIVLQTLLENKVD